MRKCGIIAHGFEPAFADENGCHKEEGHHDHHECVTTDGRKIAWEDDYNCNCGCWDDYDNDPDVCKIYWEIKS